MCERRLAPTGLARRERPGRKRQSLAPISQGAGSCSRSGVGDCHFKRACALTVNPRFVGSADRGLAVIGLFGGDPVPDRAGLEGRPSRPLFKADPWAIVIAIDFAHPPA